MLTVRIAFRFHPILGKRQPDGWIYESTVYIISQRRVINHNRACSQNSIAKFLTVMVVPQSDHRKVIDVSIPLLFHKLDFTDNTIVLVVHPDGVGVRIQLDSRSIQ